MALLTLAYALTIIDRVSLGLLVEPITTSLGISDTQFGLMLITDDGAEPIHDLGTPAITI